ncbi:hypothetical protein Tco_1291198 [Tanacetum coccineum]
MLEIKVYEMGRDEVLFTFEAWRRAFDINEPINTKLFHEFYATFMFNEEVLDEDLTSKKLIKFRLGGRAHSLTILEFALRLGLYSGEEIRDDGFETYFHRGLRSDEYFNANQYWLSISSEDELILSRSLAKTIKNPVLRVLQKMITYGLCQRTTSYDKVQRNKLWLMSMFEARNHDGLAKKIGVLNDQVLNGLSAPIYCRALDATTLRELNGSNRRLIIEDPAPGVPRVAIPRP